MPDVEASAVRTVEHLRTMRLTRWISNLTREEVAARHLGGANVLDDAFLGVRIKSIMAELGLRLDTADHAREAVLTLAAIVSRTLAMAAAAFPMTDETSLVAAAQELSITGLAEDERDELSSLLMSDGTTASLLPPTPRPGWSVVPLRRHRFAHAQDLLGNSYRHTADEISGCQMPGAPFIRVNGEIDEMFVNNIFEDNYPAFVELDAPLGGLFQHGPYGRRPILTLQEYQFYREQEQDRIPRVVQAWVASEWADHLGEVAPIAVNMNPDQLHTETKYVGRCGPLRVRGTVIMSYSLGLLGEAIWRAIITTRGAVGNWILAHERSATTKYAGAVRRALSDEGLSDSMMVRAFRHGVVWLETKLVDEELWTALALLAERTALLPPPLPLSEKGTYRYERARFLLQPQYRNAERHWQGALLSTSDDSRRGML